MPAKHKWIDQTPEEIAAACAQFAPKTHGSSGPGMNADMSAARFYAWLYDENDIRPLAAVEVR